MSVAAGIAQPVELASGLPATVNGLPLHPLVVHVVVVMIPLAVLGAITISVWPALRRHLGWLVLLGSFVGLAAVPIATNSGEAFRDRIGAAQLVRQHQHYAEQLLPWAAALFLLVLITMTVDLGRRLGPVVRGAADYAPAGAAPASAGGGVALATRPQAPAVMPVLNGLDRRLARLVPLALRDKPDLLRRVQPVVAVLTIAVALVLAWYTYKTGDSGAKAVWGGR